MTHSRTNVPELLRRVIYLLNFFMYSQVVSYISLFLLFITHLLQFLSSPLIPISRVIRPAVIITTFFLYYIRLRINIFAPFRYPINRVLKGKVDQSMKLTIHVIFSEGTECTQWV